MFETWIQNPTNNIHCEMPSKWHLLRPTKKVEPKTFRLLSALHCSLSNSLHFLFLLNSLCSLFISLTLRAPPAFHPNILSFILFLGRWNQYGHLQPIIIVPEIKPIKRRKIFGKSSALCSQITTKNQMNFSYKWFLFPPKNFAITFRSDSHNVSAQNI